MTDVTEEQITRVIKSIDELVDGTRPIHPKAWSDRAIVALREARRCLQPHGALTVAPEMDRVRAVIRRQVELQIIFEELQKRNLLIPEGLRQLFDDWIASRANLTDAATAQDGTSGDGDRRLAGQRDVPS